MNGGYSMKEYIKPDAEIIKYSFADIIAVSGETGSGGNPEDLIPDTPVDGDDSGFFD